MSSDPAYLSARVKVSTWHADEKHPEKWVPLTHEELDALAIDATKDLVAFEKKHGEGVVVNPPTSRETFTCFSCCSAATCPYVYDMYNTDGDCLKSK